MRNLNASIWKRISKNVEVPSEALNVFRIIVAIWILLFHFESFSWLGTLPDYLMKEPILSGANIFRSYPDVRIFYFLDFIRLLCLLFLLLGIKARISGVIFFCITIFCKSFQYTLGSIEHDFLLFFLIFVMSFSNWGTGYALVPDRKLNWLEDKYYLAIFAIVLCWGMFTAGLMKGLIWVDFDVNTSGFSRWLTEGYFIMERNRFLTEYMLSVDWRVLEIMDYVAVIFELIPFALIMISRRAWLIWILVAIIFHITNILVLNINFITHFLVYALFINWSAFRFKMQIVTKNYLSVFGFLLIVVFILRFIDVFFGSNYQNLLFYLFDDYYKTHLIFGIIVWALLAVKFVKEIKHA